jgi:hypothetical protein
MRLIRNIVDKCLINSRDHDLKLYYTNYLIAKAHTLHVHYLDILNPIIGLNEIKDNSFSYRLINVATLIYLKPISSKHKHKTNRTHKNHSNASNTFD